MYQNNGLDRFDKTQFHLGLSRFQTVSLSSQSKTRRTFCLITIPKRASFATQQQQEEEQQAETTSIITMNHNPNQNHPWRSPQDDVSSYASSSLNDETPNVARAARRQYDSSPHENNNNNAQQDDVAQVLANDMDRRLHLFHQMENSLSGNNFNPMAATLAATFLMSPQQVALNQSFVEM